MDYLTSTQQPVCSQRGLIALKYIFSETLWERIQKDDTLHCYTHLVSGIYFV